MNLINNFKYLMIIIDTWLTLQNMGYLPTQTISTTDKYKMTNWVDVFNKNFLIKPGAMNQNIFNLVPLVFLKFSLNFFFFDFQWINLPYQLRKFIKKLFVFKYFQYIKLLTKKNQRNKNIHSAQLDKYAK